MRASLGFRAGPLYIGTGNLLKSKPKTKGSGQLGPAGWLILAPFLVAFVAVVLLWYTLVAAYNGCVWLARRATGRPTVRDAVPHP